MKQILYTLTALVTILLVIQQRSNAQNIGVDVATPQQKLDVLGGIRIGNTTTGLAGSLRWTGTQFEGHDGTVWAPFGGNGNTSWSLTGNSGTVAGTNFLGTTDNVDFRIRTNNLDRFTVTAGGNVGIGTTTVSTLFGGNIGMEIKGDVPQILFNDNTGGSTDDFRIYNGGAFAAFQNATAGVDIISFGLAANTNNVGIGTTAPAQKLDVNGKIQMRTGATTGYIPVSDASGTMTWTNPTLLGADVTTASNGLTETGNDIQLGGALTANTTITQDAAEILTLANNGTGNTVINLQSTGDFDVQDNGTSALFIRDDANVGIGTTAPAQKLDVNGKIQMRTGATTGYVPVSDVNGTMTWTNLATSTATYLDEIRDADNDTKIQVEKNTDEDIIRFDAAGTELFTMRKIAGGSPWLEVVSTNTLIGSSISTAINGAGVYNTAVGFQAAQSLTTGQKNAYYGDNAGGSNTTGSNNTMVGTVAGQFNNGGSSNTMIGGYAGRSNLTGSGNVFLGFAAGENETGSNKLYIDNSATASPLIYGDFNTNEVNINGELGIGTANPAEELHVVGNIRMVDGNQAAGKVMVSDASGTATWTAATSLTITETDPQVSSVTSNIVPKWNGTTLTDGVITDAGTSVSVGTQTVNIGLASSSSATFLNLVRSGSSGRIYLGSGGASPNMVINAQTAGGAIALTTNAGEAMRVTDAGNVGIGTTAPESILHLRSEANDNTGGLKISSSTANAVIHLNSTSDMVLGKQNVANQLVLNNNGGVGIGTDAPTQELDVIGKIRMVDGNQAIGRVMVSNATGVATWTDPASLTITETDPQVSSTTTNYIPKWNGATLVDGIVTDNGTNVGIGSATPGAKLDVIGTARATDVMANGTSGNLMLSNSNTSATDYFRIDGNADKLYVIAESGTSGNATGTEIRFRTATTNTSAADRMTINNNGNVGIGTTAPTSPLYVAYPSGSGPAATIESGSNQYPNALSILASTHASSRRATLKLDDWSVLQDLTGTGTKDFSIYQTSAALNRMSINTSGNVGIGTTAPSELVHIQRNTSDAILKIESPGSSYDAQLMFQKNGANTGTVGFFPGTADLRLRTGQATGVLFEPNGVERMRVNSDGTVGIGTTSPNYKLEVAGGSIGTGDNYYFTNTSGTGTTPFRIDGFADRVQIIAENGTDGNTSGTEIRLRTASTNAAAVDRLTINNNGNVGIGTTAPAYDLDIYKNETAVNQRIYSNDALGIGHLLTGANGGGHINLIANSSAAAYLGVAVGVSGVVTEYTDMVFATGTSGTGTEQMRITTGGSVGIGSNNPTQAKLVVNGSQSTTLSYGYLNNAGNTGTSTNQTVPYSIYASARIAATEFNAYSDQRIKNIKGISDSYNDLQTLMNIEVTDYTFIDKVEKGNGNQKKVIAQQVEKIYPQAVSTITDVVPDIYKIAEINSGRITIANNLKAGEKVKLIFENRTELVEVAAADQNGFNVNLIDNGQVFVFGREVNDFRTVDYEALSTLNISATQELVKMMNQLKTENTEMKNKFSALSSDVEIMKALLQMGTKAEK